MSEENPTVAQVVSQRLRELREERGLSQDEVVGGLQQLGLDWTQSALAKIETGHRDLDRLPELIIVARYFEVALVDLVTTGRRGDLVRLNDKAGATQRQLARILGSEPVKSLRPLAFSPGRFTREEARSLIRRAERVGGIDFKHPAHPKSKVLDMTQDARRDAEQKAARRLGVEPFDVAAASYGLWGRTLTSERDNRVKERLAKDDDLKTRRAKSGHVTRKLLEELDAHLRAHRVRRSR